MKKYKAILFDLDGTLVFGEPDVWMLYTQFAREYGLPVSEDAARRSECFAHHYFAGFNYKEDFDRLGGGEAWRVHYLQRSLHIMSGESRPVETLEEAARFVLRRLLETPRTRFVPADVRATLDHLFSDCYTLGLVTNRREDEMADMYDPFGLDCYFAFTVTSSDAGAPKPYRGIFDLALSRAGCTAAEAVHVGDNPYADVAGAQSAGITPILFDPKGLFPDASCRVIKSFPQLLENIA